MYINQAQGGPLPIPFIRRIGATSYPVTANTGLTAPRCSLIAALAQEQRNRTSCNTHVCISKSMRN